ncbi:PKD domain-containing protein [Halosegnis sp.]|uniref:PKD domain-containing protein n=1 Tax=Halosegnis sp. TaxID=2864959 RepID=UPI0035D4EE47
MPPSVAALRAAQWRLLLVGLVCAAPIVAPVAAHSPESPPAAASIANAPAVATSPAPPGASLPGTSPAAMTTASPSPAGGSITDAAAPPRRPLTASHRHMLGATVASAPVHTAATAATTAATDPPIMAFATADTSTLTTYDDAGKTTPLGVSTAVAGPLHDVDGDGTLEAIYVDGSGQLHLVDEQGETEALAATNAPTSKTMFAVGDFDGDGTLAVFYVNTADNNYLYKVEYGEEPTQVAATGAKAALGVTDFDDDGDTDVVFLGGSSTIKFYDGSLHSTGYSSIGSNNGIGVGAPADFDGDGVPRVPIVDGSNNPALVAADGGKTVLKSGSAVKAPIAGVDVTGDEQLELVYVSKDGKVAYTTLGDSTDTLTGADGSTLAAAKKVGVVGAAPPPAPAITDYTVTNPSGADVRVTFNATQQLATIEVPITRDGTLVATLTAADFTETAHADGYQYTATYTVATDGDYTATLATAADSDGDTASSTPSGTVSVAVPPTISDYTVENPTARNLVVAFSASEQLQDITVAVDGPTSQTLTASDFAEATTATGYRYQARVTVSADGIYTATLQTAMDAAGNDGATGQSQSIIIDTPDPRVVDATVVDLGDRNGIVTDGTRVRITATVEGAQVTQVTSDLSALGAGTVTLAHAGGDSYQTTVVVDGDDAAQAGSFTFGVQATNSFGNADTRRTDPLLLDTVPPSADTGPDVTVEEGTKVVLDAAASSDNIALASYTWWFGDDTQDSGEAVVHVYEEPGTYTVRLVAADAAGNRDTATRTITVTDTPETPTVMPVTTPTDDEPVRVVEVVRILKNTTTTPTTTNASVIETVRFQNGTVRAIQFREEPPTGTLRVERLATLPSGVPAYRGTVIWPLEITFSNETTAPARIIFSLDRDTLGGLAPERVTLLRHSDGTWERLATSVVTRGPETVRFAAETPGFSYFAVAVPPQAHTTATSTPTATTTDTATTTATSVEPTPTESATAAPETTATGAGGGGVPLWPLAAGLLVVPLVGVWGYRQGYFDQYLAGLADSSVANWRE